MTYIAAFHCMGGIVMCADTQETEGEHKNYVEKICTVDDFSYPLAVGGAGAGDIVDVATDEIIEQAKQSKPKTKIELRTLVRESLRKVYEDDLPTLVLPKQHRTPRLLVAARTEKDGFCILPTIGRRVQKEVRRAIIGYATAYNNELLRRLHRDSMSMQQAVMLAVYVAQQSKKFDTGVEGETRVAVITENGAYLDDREYILNSENRVKEFLELTDRLFLDSIDVSIPPSELTKRLEDFQRGITRLRNNYLRYAVARTLQRISGDQTYRGDPYPKVFLGAKATISATEPFLQVSEATEEERAKFRELIKLAESNQENRKGTQLPKLLEGRKILYIGNETATIHPKSGSTG